VSDPENPTQAALIVNSSLRELNGARSMDLVGDFLYVASYADHGLQIIDISNPENPIVR